ncbi:unnamed protein product [Cuscuta epithymum]|uniref:Plant bHLH transcription factor ACT-like domain-containing protein n=1 Tax=Cuscuta epithymum TaxID=186058 RepID=A0AAV0C0T2_9ASTE|nr:unnamed protein product [Cuscuta epithymum]
MLPNDEQERDMLLDKMQLLRSVTNSDAMSETSIIMDATRYIQELKDKVGRANQESEFAAASLISTNNTNSSSPSCPKFSVEYLEKGFFVKVYSETSCPGLLVALLEAFEELSLNVLEARVSSMDNFHLQAIGGEKKEDNEDGRMNTEVVIEALQRAIKNWCENN